MHPATKDDETPSYNHWTSYFDIYRNNKMRQ